MGGGEGAVGEFGRRRRRAQSANGRKEGRGAVGVVVSDSEEELEVLRQPNLIQMRIVNLIQKLADVTPEGGCRG